MNNLLQNIHEAARFLAERNFYTAKTAVVLGTGLGSLLEKINITSSIPYHEIPHFVSSTVESHKGQLILGTLNNKPVMIMQGRFHYYEGYSMQQITFPVRVMKALGTERLLLSNASGGINPGYKKGDLVLTEDHINLLPENPLRGLNDPAFGNRFPDMSRPYDKSMSKLLKKCAKGLSIKLKSGIYVAVPGPNLETRAEYRFLRIAGADMVGMSTVPEVIAANQVGLPCACVSIITDECDPDHLEPVSISQIIDVARKADKKLARLFASFLVTV